jgi:hypothetical protein
MTFCLGSVGASVFGLLALLVGLAISLAAFAFWLWMLIHAITNRGLRDTEKILWVILIIFLPFLGSVIYFFVGRPRAGP